MISAHLYLNDVCIKIEALNVDHAPLAIGIYSESGYFPSLLTDDSILMSSEVECMIGVYELKEPIYKDDMEMEMMWHTNQYPQNWKYKFSHFERPYMQKFNGTFDIGFREPDENVNLDKLKNKFKHSDNIKQHLMEFLRQP